MPKHKCPEPEPDTSKAWLDSYADAMTLLLAFFILLFAFSLVDQKKFQEFKAGVHLAAGKAAPTLDGGNGILDLGTGLSAQVVSPPVLVDGEKVDLNEIVERKFSGDKVAIRFLRDGSWNDVEVALKPIPPSRMYAVQYEKKPRYVVFAGLVFQPLDTNLFATSKFKDVTVRRLYSDYVSKGIFQEKKDIVILTRMEADPVTSRIGNFKGLAVDKINGLPVRDLKHAHEMLYAENPPEFHVIELYGANRPIIIPSAKVEEANQRVQSSYSINKLYNLED